MSDRTSLFISKAIEMWGDRWDYTKVVYTNNHSKVTIGCSMHGDFYQPAKYHLKGRMGCPGCYSNSSTTQEFVSKAEKKLGKRWDYSEVVYIHSDSKVTIKCSMHGSFEQTPTQHLLGKIGCRECSYVRSSTEDFIEKAQEKFGDRWDYSEVEYLGAREPVVIICPNHGKFEQRAGQHLSGSIGCVKCQDRGRMGGDEFILNANEVWGDRWDYSQVEFVSRETKVTIICPDHGSFEQTPYRHLRGAVGCALCVNTYRSSTNSGFISKAEGVWGDRWDYSEIDYVTSRSMLSIGCPDHGVFTQVAHSHLYGAVGCPGCYTNPVSGAEETLQDFVTSLGVDVTLNSRDLLPPSRQEVDIFAPATKVAIEFNGLYWHSDRFKSSSYHFDKWKLAQDNGINLLQVWEDDWSLRPEIVKEHIRQVLGVSEVGKVYARNTEIQVLNHQTAHPFLNAYHIQGKANASIYLGLIHENSVVAVAAFLKSGEDLTLTRYATSCNVVGGHSKLVRYVERNYTYRNLVTFADITFGSGGLYKTTGWVEDKLLRPDYSYVIRNSRVHKFNYRVQRFKTDSGLLFEEGMTESELAELNNLIRVYDAGKIRFKRPRL